MVVSVIGLLVAILVPSLAKSRENARATVCKTQLMEWGRAMNSYAASYGNALPFEDRPKPADDLDGDFVWDETGWICWYDALDRHFGSKKVDPRMKVCPSVPWSDPNREESYRMNSKLAEANVSDDPTKEKYERAFRKIDTLDRPSDTVILFDGDIGGGTPEQPDLDFKGRWRFSSGRDDVNYRHLKAANILFADWHVEHLRKDVLAERSLKNSRMIWQPPDVGEWDPDPPVQ